MFAIPLPRSRGTRSRLHHAHACFRLIYSQYINDRYTRGLRLNRLADYCSAAIQPNVVLVLVEAWGLAREMALRRAIDQPFSDPARYDVLRGSMPFVGHTTSGEGG